MKDPQYILRSDVVVALRQRADFYLTLALNNDQDAIPPQDIALLADIIEQRTTIPEPSEQSKRISATLRTKK